MNQALNLEGVSKRYGAFEAVKNLSFSVDKGSICGFLGPNGAGKTSTIRMILGLTAPTEGSIMVLGADDGRKVRDRIGFLPEERGLYRKMTPVDAVAYFASLKGVPPSEGRKRAREMLEAQGLGDALKRPMKSLSKGMAQKVQLVAAIAHRPELVILDEPFSGLDPVNQQGLERVIRDLADQGATVLFSTHVMQHAERLCRKVVLLAKGQKVFEGDVAGARAAAPRYLTLEGALSREDVAALPGVSEVEAVPPPSDGPPPEGQVWRARLQAGAQSQASLRAAFERNLALTRFEAHEPSLHDAFIVLTGGDQ